MKIFAYDTPLMQALAKLADLMLLNLLFLLCAIPVFTLGASLTALYSMLWKLVDGKETRVVIPFLNAFRAEFKKGVGLFFLLLVPGLAVALGIYQLYVGAAQSSLLVTILLMLPFVLYLTTVSFAYPMNARFDSPVGRTVKNALVLSVANLPIGILTAALNLVPVILFLAAPEFFVKWLIVWVLVGFAAIAAVNRRLLERIFRRFYPEPEQQPELPEEASQE